VLGREPTCQVSQRDVVGREGAEAEEGSLDISLEVGECHGESIFCALCADLRGPRRTHICCHVMEMCNDNSDERGLRDMQIMHGRLHGLFSQNK
jgi:hypothetical protein